jgi:hypothetical protein
MATSRRAGTAAALLCAALLAVGAPAVAGAAAAPLATTLTGTYQLYCPDPVETPIVLHVRATAAMSPAAPAPGRHFLVSGFQTEVTFPQALAPALAKMSPITGNVRGTVLLVGATPARHPVAEPFVAAVPTSVPPGGFHFLVPTHPASLGDFTATSASTIVEEASRFQLTLVVGSGAQADKRVLACTAFANGTADFEPSQPWVGTKEPPISDAITPVIAVGR